MIGELVFCCRIPLLPAWGSNQMSTLFLFCNFLKSMCCISTTQFGNITCSTVVVMTSLVEGTPSTCCLKYLRMCQNSGRSLIWLWQQCWFSEVCEKLRGNISRYFLVVYIIIWIICNFTTIFKQYNLVLSIYEYIFLHLFLIIKFGIYITD